MPAPWALAMAVLGMLSLGVLIGSVTDHYAQNAGFPTVLLESSAPPPEEAAAPETAAAEPEEVEASGGESAAAPPSAIPTEAPWWKNRCPNRRNRKHPAGGRRTPHRAAGSETRLRDHAEGRQLRRPAGTKANGLSPPSEAQIRGRGRGERGTDRTDPAGRAADQLLRGDQGALANQIALLSGQGPTPETAANCPNYADVAPGAESAEGQVEGNGCVYPATTKTLPGQLTEADLKWKAYVQGIEDGAAAGQPTTGRHPPASPTPI